MLNWMLQGWQKYAFRSIHLYKVPDFANWAGGGFDNIRPEAGESFFRGRWPSYIHNNQANDNDNGK